MAKTVKQFGETSDDESIGMLITLKLLYMFYEQAIWCLPEKKSTAHTLMSALVNRNLGHKTQVLISETDFPSGKLPMESVLRDRLASNTHCGYLEAVSNKAWMDAFDWYIAQGYDFISYIPARSLLKISNVILQAIPFKRLIRKRDSGAIYHMMSGDGRFHVESTIYYELEFTFRAVRVGA